MQAINAKEALAQQLSGTAPLQDVEALRTTNMNLTAELADAHNALRKAGELVRLLA